MTTTLWPLAPLLDAMGRPRPSITAAAAMAGVDRRQLYRWRAAGGLSDREADRVACAMGTHPVLVWPDWLAGSLDTATADDQRFPPR